MWIPRSFWPRRKLARTQLRIRAHLAELLGIPSDCVGLKAKTPEGMGTDNAAIAHAVVLLEKKGGQASGPRKPKNNQPRQASFRGSAFRIADSRGRRTWSHAPHQPARGKLPGKPHPFPPNVPDAIARPRRNGPADVPSNASMIPSSGHRATTRSPSPGDFCGLVMTRVDRDR